MKYTERNTKIKIRTNYFKIIVLLMLTMLLPSVKGSAQMTAKQIDSLVTIAVNTVDYTLGFAIGVVKDGKILHVKGYGVNSVDLNEAGNCRHPIWHCL